MAAAVPRSSLRSLSDVRWYVQRNGETVGPVDEAAVIEWVRGGMVDAQVQGEAGGPWLTISQSPFAGYVTARPTSRYRPGTTEKVVVASTCVTGVLLFGTMVWFESKKPTVTPIDI